MSEPARFPSSLGQFARFAAVGASGVLVNLGVFNAVLSAWHALGDHAPMSGDFLANGLGFVTSVISNYLLNRRWTFRSSGPMAGEMARFVTVSVLAYAANVLVFALCRGGLGIAANPSQLIAIAVVTPINFTANKLWSFRSVRET